MKIISSIPSEMKVSLVYPGLFTAEQEVLNDFLFTQLFALTFKERSKSKSNYKNKNLK